MLSNSVVSDSLRPHGLQPTRLLLPWDFPGKSTGVGCQCTTRPFKFLLVFLPPGSLEKSQTDNLLQSAYVPRKKVIVHARGLRFFPLEKFRFLPSLIQQLSIFKQVILSYPESLVVYEGTTGQPQIIPSYP